MQFYMLIFCARSKIKCTPKEGKKKEVPWTSVTMGLPQLNSNEGTMGRNKLSIKNSAHHSHFTWEERIQLQYYHNGSNGYSRIRSPKALGVFFGKDESTIRRE
jgi:hypothetical protein